MSSAVIKCRSPPLNLTIELKVFVPGAGSVSLILPVNLKLFNFTPTTGSIFGGTLITFNGQGFGEKTSDVKVVFKGKTCAVQSCTDNKITCITPRASNTVYIDNSGRGVFGVGTAWSKNTIYINEGDSIVYSWYSIRDSKFLISVKRYSVGNPDATELLCQPKYSGKCLVIFSTAGTYILSSGKFVNNNNAEFNGTVVVSVLSQSQADVSLSVKGLDVPLSSENVRKRRDNPTTYSYDAALTPIVQNIGYDSCENIRIVGTGFSENIGDNNVTFGNLLCVIKYASQTEIFCSMNRDETLPTAVMLPIMLYVEGKGFAHIQITKEEDQSIFCFPELESIAPVFGSIAGGTKLRINGFNLDLPTTHVYINHADSLNCNFLSFYTCLCTMPPLLTIQPIVNVTVSVCDDAEQVEHCLKKPTLNFVYQLSTTPEIVSVQPTVIQNPNAAIQISGKKFGNVSSIIVQIGPSNCNIFNLTTQNDTQTITCTVSLPAGAHIVNVEHLDYGNSLNSANLKVTSNPTFNSIMPSNGSVYGYTVVVIKGNGFCTDLVVKFDTVAATVQKKAIDELTVVSPPHSAGSVKVQLYCSGILLVSGSFLYTLSSTPSLINIVPNFGKVDDEVTFNVTFKTASLVNLTVFVGVDNCKITAVNSGSIKIILPMHAAGPVSAQILVPQLGLSNTLQFTYLLEITNVSILESGYGGGHFVNILGNGFSNTSKVFICNNSCIQTIFISTQQLTCRIPPYTSSTATITECSILVINNQNLNATYGQKYVYRASLTSILTSVSPMRGGTGGGVNLTISGDNFDLNSQVTIAGVDCPLSSISNSQIICRTGPSSSTVQDAIVEVFNYKSGLSLVGNVRFSYIDVWSSKFTWGGNDPPVEGEIIDLK